MECNDMSMFDMVNFCGLTYYGCLLMIICEVLVDILLAYFYILIGWSVLVDDIITLLSLKLLGLKMLHGEIRN